MMKLIARPKKVKKGVVLRLGPGKPRLVRLPLHELVMFPVAAEYSHDNKAIANRWGLICAMGLGLLGALWAAIGVFSEQQGINGANVTVLFSVPLALMIAGWVVGSKVVARAFFLPNYWIVRDKVATYTETDETGETRTMESVVPEAVLPDAEVWKEWAVYFQHLKTHLRQIEAQRRRAASSDGGEEPESRTMVNPLAVEAVTTRFHAGTMAAIARMDNVAEDISGGLSMAAKIAAAGVTGLVAVAFIGLIAFTIILGDDRSSKRQETSHRYDHGWTQTI